MKVLLATDGSEYSVKTGRLLSLMPFPDDTEVTVLSVIGSAYMDIPDRYMMQVDERVKEAVAIIREKEYSATDRNNNQVTYNNSIHGLIMPASDFRR